MGSHDLRSIDGGDHGHIEALIVLSVGLRKVGLLLIALLLLLVEPDSTLLLPMPWNATMMALDFLLLAAGSSVAARARAA